MECSSTARVEVEGVALWSMFSNLSERAESSREILPGTRSFLATTGRRCGMRCKEDKSHDLQLGGSICATFCLFLFRQPLEKLGNQSVLDSRGFKEIKRPGLLLKCVSGCFPKQSQSVRASVCRGAECGSLPAIWIAAVHVHFNRCASVQQASSKLPIQFRQVNGSLSLTFLRAQSGCESECLLS